MGKEKMEKMNCGCCGALCVPGCKESARDIL